MVSELLLVLAVAQSPTIARELRNVARDIEKMSCERIDAISLLPHFGAPDPKPDPEVVERERRIDQARTAIDRRLREHPDDAAAWLLSARLGYVVGGCGAWAGSLEPTDTTYTWTSPPLDVAPLHAALDRALQLHPGFAEAHYWKALLYHVNQPVVRGRELKNFVDLDRTIEQAEKATRLEPSDPDYRLLWGQTLIEAGRESEAIPVLEQLDRGRHLLFLILKDFEALPLPSGTVAWPRTPEDSQAVPEWAGNTLYAAAMESSYIGQSPERDLTHQVPLGRLRSWVVPLTRAELEAHFRSVWPTFHFFQPDSLVGKGVQHLQVRSDRSMLPADRPPIDENHGPNDGLLLVVSDGNRIEQTPALAGMPAQTLLVVLNYRKAKR